MKCRKKPIVIDARGPILVAEMVATLHGAIPAEVGDYVLTDPASGDTWPIKPNIFTSTYDVVEEVAK